MFYSNYKCRLWNQKDIGLNLRSTIYKQLHSEVLDNLRFHQDD